MRINVGKVVLGVLTTSAVVSVVVLGGFTSDPFSIKELDVKCIAYVFPENQVPPFHTSSFLFANRTSSPINVRHTGADCTCVSVLIDGSRLRPNSIFCIGPGSHVRVTVQFQVPPMSGLHEHRARWEVNGKRYETAARCVVYLPVEIDPPAIVLSREHVQDGRPRALSTLLKRTSQDKRELVGELRAKRVPSYIRLRQISPSAIVEAGPDIYTRSWQIDYELQDNIAGGNDIENLWLTLVDKDELARSQVSIPCLYGEGGVWKRQDGPKARIGIVD